MLGCYWDNGKENGNYYIILYLETFPGDAYGGFPKLGVPTIMENQMEKKMEN